MSFNDFSEISFENFDEWNYERNTLKNIFKLVWKLFGYIKFFIFKINVHSSVKNGILKISNGKWGKPIQLKTYNTNVIASKTISNW